MHKGIAVSLQLTDANLDHVAFSAFVEKSNAHAADFGHDIVQVCLLSEQEDQIGGAVKAQQGNPSNARVRAVDAC